MQERYEIRDKLGQGGLGTVYRAWDHTLNREVAVKRILAGQDEHHQDEATRQMTQETGALAAIQHPHIVTIYDVGTDEDGPFVVMELIKGGTIDEIVEKAPLTWEDFRNFILQVQEGMIAAQDLNLVHRDLKPSNIMLNWLPSGKFQVKIVDFGLAKFSREPTAQTVDHKDSVYGSIFFMAPEQFERLPLDSRTDMYAIGCVYYFSLTGSMPFQGDTGPQVMASHLEHRVVPLAELRPDIPNWAADWVMWHINRSPDARPTNAREALKTVIQLDQPPTQVMSTGNPDPSPDSSKRPRLIIPGAAPEAAAEPAPAPEAPSTPIPAPPATQTAPQPLQPPSDAPPSVHTTSQQSVHTTPTPQPATPVPAASPVEPATPVPPAATPVPPAATPVPPAATPVPPAATPVPPAATPVPPAATPVPPAATPVPPAATPVPPAATPVPPAAAPVAPASAPIQAAVPVQPAAPIQPAVVQPAAPAPAPAVPTQPTPPAPPMQAAPPAAPAGGQPGTVQLRSATPRPGLTSPPAKQPTAPVGVTPGAPAQAGAPNAGSGQTMIGSQLPTAKKGLSGGAKIAISAVLAILVIIAGIMVANTMSGNKSNERYNALVAEAAKPETKELAISSTDLDLLLDSTRAGSNRSRETVYKALSIATPTDGTNIDARIAEFATGQLLPDEIRVSLLSRVIRKRKNPEVMPVLLKFARETENDQVAAAAITAVTEIGGEAQLVDFLDVIQFSGSSATRRAAEGAAAAILKKAENSEQYASSLAAAYEGASSDETRHTLIRLLGAAGGAEAETIITDALNGDKPLDTLASIEALKNWTDDSMFETLMEFLDEQTDEKIRPKAFNAGYVFLTDRSRERDDADNEDFWKMLARNAKTEREQFTIISGLAETETSDWAMSVIEYFADDSDSDDVIDRAEKALNHIRERMKVTDDDDEEDEE